MARGADAKAERKVKRKEVRASAADVDSSAQDYLDNGFDKPFIPKKDDNSVSSEDDDDKEEDTGVDIVKIAEKIKKGKKKRAASAGDQCCGPKASGGGGGGGIKTTPLILLIMLTGTTLLPALMYAGSLMGGAFKTKKSIFGSMGYKLGIGSSPKKRVLSFYEKHDPAKLEAVPTILAQYYGDYPKLVKKLERKYGDYGYFLQWENDEAPLTLVKEKVEDTFMYVQKIFNAQAPQIVKTGVRNMKYNLSFLYKKLLRIWKKKMWPVLEPFFGVPKGAAQQKRKDAETAGRRKRGEKGKRNTEYRDEEF